MRCVATVASELVTTIRLSGMTIYDRVEIGDPRLWIPSREMEYLLNEGLRGMSLFGMPLRTRSRAVKRNICQILGYPVPERFARVRPRFPAQCFDVYIQKSNNLQIWNEEISPTRRYVIVRVSETDRVTRVKVVTGDVLALFDTTGTLTQKFQARFFPGTSAAELVSLFDTDVLRPVVSDVAKIGAAVVPTDNPSEGALLSIATVLSRLQVLLGASFPDPGCIQERNRGASLHQRACLALGYTSYFDDGRFPDVRHQLLEVKLQTSATVDLGLFSPDSEAPLDIPKIGDRQARRCDVRYAIFSAHIDGHMIKISHLLVLTGEDFFKRCLRFGGRILNKKLQIPLPGDFFEV